MGLFFWLILLLMAAWGLTDYELSHIERPVPVKASPKPPAPPAAPAPAEAPAAASASADVAASGTAVATPNEAVTPAPVNDDMTRQQGAAMQAAVDAAEAGDATRKPAN
jgi:hypothetical protein